MAEVHCPEGYRLIADVGTRHAILTDSIPRYCIAVRLDGRDCQWWAPLAVARNVTELTAALIACRVRVPHGLLNRLPETPALPEA